jgi:hypothetical protein
MSNSKMFIPDKIKVGYQNRTDTYTKKLAYVIYYDNKGVLRKEASWKSWRDNKIDPQEFVNEPTSGFVLNKGVGGVKHSYGWNARNEYIRVYDPRDFEFEISIANLLFILQETSAIKGKGLEGEFVYSWDGTELVLLPVDSKEYKSCKEHTERQSKSLSKEDIKEGFSYIMKDGTNVMYLGKFHYNNSYYENGLNPVGKKHIFLVLDKNNISYIAESGFAKVAEYASNSISTDYANNRDEFLKSKYYCNIINIEIQKCNVKVDFEKCCYSEMFLTKENDKYRITQIRSNHYYYNGKRNTNIYKSELFIPKISKNKITIPNISDFEEIQEDAFNNLEKYHLYAVTDSGSKIKII